MLLIRLWSIVLMPLYFLIYFVSALYQDAVVIVNLELTITSDSKLNDDISDDMGTLIDTAYRDANTATSIYNIDTIDINSSYGYFNAFDYYEYGAILKIYFDSQNAYDEGVDSYRRNVYNDLLAFVVQFEGDLLSTAQSTLNTTDPSSITQVEIQTLRIVQIDIAAQSGEMMVKFNGESTTTNSPTGLTLNPTKSPTFNPSVSPTKNPISTVVVTQKTEANNYAFDNEALYWVIAVLFLFVGCCLGCGCWGYLWIKTDMRKYFDGKRRGRNAPPPKKKKKRRTRETERETSEEIALARKRREREAKQREREREELQKKRDRYIEYGSDDDSDKEKKIFEAPPKRKTVPTYTADENEEVSTSEDVKVTMQKVSYSSPSEEDRAKSPRRPKHRHKNKKTGAVEPIRYADDGTRQLTTKELMMQYKKKGKRGGDSVDLSYKVGGKHRARSKDDNDIVSPSDQSQSDRSRPAYEYDVEDLEDENHPHFKPQHPRRKVKSTKHDDRSRKGKKSNKAKHARSATGGLADLASSSPKIKYKRPRSARHDGGGSKGSRAKKSRPQSARPGPRSPPRSPGSRGSRASRSHKKKQRRKRTNDEYDDYGDDYYGTGEYDEYERAAKKKSTKRHRRHRDTDEGDGNSGSAESY